MRRPEHSMSRGEALALLARAPVIHLAATGDGGLPVLRTLNAVVVDDWILFHGSRVGEKTDCLGKAAVITAEEILATVPSYFVDPVLACPATTLYRSAQVHGTLERVDDLDLKAAMLAGLMRKYQPEGGYAPISREAPEYARVLRGILVAGLRLSNVTGKSKLAQNRSPGEVQKIAAGLWRRGAPADPEAVEAVIAANPRAPLPDFLVGPAGTRLLAALDESAVEAAAQLAAGEYWRAGCSRREIADAFLSSTARVGARSSDGALIAAGRAVTDRCWHAYVADVVVAPSFRGRGIGRAVMQLLLDHPAVRHVAAVRLGTIDAQSFYESLGFVAAGEADVGFRATAMVRIGASRERQLRSTAGR